MKHRKCRQSSLGASIVEMTLVLGLLTLLVAGGIKFYLVRDLGSGLDQGVKLVAAELQGAYPESQKFAQAAEIIQQSSDANFSDATVSVDHEKLRYFLYQDLSGAWKATMAPVMMPGPIVYFDAVEGSGDPQVTLANGKILTLRDPTKSDANYIHQNPIKIGSLSGSTPCQAAASLYLAQATMVTARGQESTFNYPIDVRPVTSLFVSVGSGGCATPPTTSCNDPAISSGFAANCALLGGTWNYNGTPTLSAVGFGCCNCQNGLPITSSGCPSATYLASIGGSGSSSGTGGGSGSGGGSGAGDGSGSSGGDLPPGSGGILPDPGLDRGGRGSCAPCQVSEEYVDKDGKIQHQCNYKEAGVLVACEPCFACAAKNGGGEECLPKSYPGMCDICDAKAGGNGIFHAVDCSTMGEGCVANPGASSADECCRCGGTFRGPNGSVPPGLPPEPNDPPPPGGDPVTTVGVCGPGMCWTESPDCTAARAETITGSKGTDLAAAKAAKEANIMKQCCVACPGGPVDISSVVGEEGPRDLPDPNAPTDAPGLLASFTPDQLAVIRASCEADGRAISCNPGLQPILTQSGMVLAGAGVNGQLVFECPAPGASFNLANGSCGPAGIVQPGGSVAPGLRDPNLTVN